MAMDFEAEKAENKIRSEAFKICDACKVDPISCSYKYGNRFKCRMLAEQIDKIFNKSA